MRRRRGSTGRWRAVGIAATIPLLVAGLLTVSTGSAAAAGPTTAYAAGKFNLDVPGVVGESNVVLGQPPTQAVQAMPVGNGSAGAAVWAANGLTAQLNRGDTFPDRKSPGQINLPGLTAMTAAANYKGWLDLYTGTFIQQGGGITARTYLRADKDEMVVDVTGASPDAAQSVTASLWAGRTPVAAKSADGTVGTLAETWKDNSTGGDNSTWGSLLGVTAAGRGVASTVVDSRTVRVDFKPNADGSFRVIVAVPSYKGGDGPTTAQALLGTDVAASSAELAAGHTAWWANYWNGAELLKMSSADGVAQYLGNLRTLYLYQQASLMRGQYPGSQAGTAPLFSFSQDTHQWVPADYWWWNIRMQVAANMSSGIPEMNASTFDLYINNVANIEAWTRTHVPGTQGGCVSETMRYNGGGDYGGWTANRSCDTTIAPSYNSQSFASGGQIVFMIWQQYLKTGDRSLLERAYPLMKSVAQFYMTIGTVEADGYRHVVGNENEQQWAVRDPNLLLAAEATSLPIVKQVAAMLGRDADMIPALDTAIAQVPPITRTDWATKTQVVSGPAKDGDPAYILALSAQPNAPTHNTENTQLEPVWPFGLFGDTPGAQRDLAVNTYNRIQFRQTNDWSYNSVYAARLGLADQVASELTADTKKFQSYVNGFATLSGGVGTEFYNEQQGIVALALNEALVQDYDGTIRVAPAWPSAWDVAGSIATRNNGTIDVQYSGGALSTVLFEAGADGTQSVRNPWPGKQVEVRDVTTNTLAVPGSTGAVIGIPATSGHNYLIQPVDAPTTALPYAAVTGTAATAARHLGPVQIGLDAAAPAVEFESLRNNVGISRDANTAPGNFDGGNASMSYEALAAVGAAPGAKIQAGGLTFTWPAVATGGTNDNVVANGQRIAVNKSGSSLGFLVSASWGPATGTGTVAYTDGTTQSFTLGSPDWLNGTATVALKPLYANRSGNTQYRNPAYINVVTVPLTAGKTVATVTLPAISAAPAANRPTLHVFAMAGSWDADTTAPVVTAALAGRTATLTATDTGGTGVKSVEYALDGGAWTAYTQPVTVDGSAHSLTYRATDLAGNVSAVGMLAIPAVTPTLDLTVTAGGRCVAGKAMPTITVTNDEDVPVSVTVRQGDTTKQFGAIAPGRNGFHAFTTRQATVAAGTISVTATATIAGQSVTATQEAPFAAITCS